MASTNAIQGAPSNLTNTIDGLTYLYSNGNTITGNYLNSNTNTSNVNTQIKLQYAGQFDIQDDTGLSAFNINDISRITTLARGQQSGAPVVGSDLTNKSYVDTQVGNPIQKTGTTTGLNGNAVLSTVSGSTFSFSDGSGNNLVVYGQNSTSSYTAGGIWTVYTSNSPTLALIQCVESTRITSFYNPQTSYTAIDPYDIPNKLYVDAAITSGTSGFWQKTGSIGLSGLYQLLASSSILFQNSSGTSLLTLSGSGVGINNGVLSGTTNLFTLYNTFGGSNQLLQIDSTGNLQNCPNLSYVYGGSGSTIKTTIPTAIGGQLQSLQWIRNTASPLGWRLNCDYEAKFAQSDIPITIPQLYSSTLNITNTNTDYITLKNTTNSVGDYMNIAFNHGSSNYSAYIQSYLDTGNNVYLRFFVTNNATSISSWFMSSTIASNISNLTSFANYFKISDASNHGIITSVSGLAINVSNALAGFFTSTGLSVYSAGTPIVFQGVSSGLDQIGFQRTSNNSNISFANVNYIAYATTNGAWLSNSLAGDLCLLTTTNNVRLGTNGSTRLSVLNNGNVGINNTAPSGKFHVSTGGFNSAVVTDWDSTWSVFSNTATSRSGGLGIGFNTNGTNTKVYYYNLAPNIAWLDSFHGANGYYFNSYGGSNVFNIAWLGTGIVYSNGGNLTNINPSDETLKCHINPMTNNLELILQLIPKSFHWKDEQVSKLNYGFIAQDVQKVIPLIVSEYKVPPKLDGPKVLNKYTGMLEDEPTESKLGLDTMSLIPFLVGAIKEQQVQINNQASQIERLMKLVESLAKSS
jgi:hypothetical protein